MGCERISPNGYKVVMQQCGKQTLLQLFDEKGNIIKTRLKAVTHSTIPPIQSKSVIGFEQSYSNEVKYKIKDIFTITKNDYDHAAQKSHASILDRVYIWGEKVGERIISAQGKRPMDAMNKIKGKPIEKGGWWKRESADDTLVAKVLRHFKDGFINKENRYEFVKGIRRSRTNVDISWERRKQMEKSFREQFEKTYTNRLRQINNEITKLTNELKESIPREKIKNFDGIMNIDKYGGYVPSYVCILERNKALMTKDEKLKMKYIKTLAKEKKEIWYSFYNKSDEIRREYQHMRHPEETIYFNGSKLRSDIEHVEFTL